MVLPPGGRSTIAGEALERLDENAPMSTGAGVPHDVTWQDFQSTRNSVLEALRPFGTVGPLGTAQITSDAEGPPRPWPVETADPEFFVVDDMWNDWDRVVTVETEHPQLITLPLMHRLRSVLASDRPDWAVGLAIENGYVLLTATKIQVKGEVFRSCRVAGDIVDALAKTKDPRR